jgi:hypothetical protein
LSNQPFSETTVKDGSSIASAVSWHTYGGNQAGAPYSSFQGDKAYAALEGYIFVQTGEFGWNTDGSDQQTQATFDVTGLLDAFSIDDVQTAVYELQAQGDGGYGLFDGTTPKAPATTIHNLTTILADPGQNAATFASGSLTYTISGMTSNMHSYLFEKSDGTFDFAVWDEGDNGTFTVNFSSPQQNVAVYDPLQGTNAIQSESNTRSINMALSGSDVQIVQIGGNAAPGSGDLPTVQPPVVPAATPTPTPSPDPSAPATPAAGGSNTNPSSTLPAPAGVHSPTPRPTPSVPAPDPSYVPPAPIDGPAGTPIPASLQPPQPPAWIDVGDHSAPSVGQVIEDISTDPGASAFAQVFTSADIARGPWMPITLDTLGHGSFAANFMAPGDYLNVVNDPTQPTAHGWSVQAA